ncbi:MAG: FxsA family protein [Micavibrio sp.]|nr:FxsA family protein [Micavibrio sp.]
MPIILIFIIIPFIELTIFGVVAEKIGVWTTLFLALLTAIIGGTLVKRQGVQTLLAMRHSMDKGQMPVSEMFDGFCLIAAGALLITPGFFTDTIGFALLIPQARAVVRGTVVKYQIWGAHDTHTSSSPPPHEHYNVNQGDIIEGEYEEVKDPHDKSN